MVTGTHPEDVDLFDYVEGDLPPARAAELEAHLASCTQCAEHVARVRTGKEVLRESQFLQLPSGRRERLLASLPARPRLGRVRPAISPKRLLAILAPLAAVAAVVAAIVTNGDFSGTGGGGGGITGAEATRKAAPQAAEGGGAAGTTGSAYDAATALTAKGSPAAVASELRRMGFDARVVGDHVEVRNATRAEVGRALGKRRRTGAVRIVFVK